MGSYAVSLRDGRLPRALRDAPAELIRDAQGAAVGAALPYLTRRLALRTQVGATSKARQSVTTRMEAGAPVTGHVG